MFLSQLNGDRAVCRVQECDMGNMIADAMRHAVMDKGYTIALMQTLVALGLPLIQVKSLLERL